MIKKLSITVVLATLFLWVGAQENQNEYTSIFKKNEGKKTEHGGYGSIGFGYTNIDNKDALLVSIKGAWIIDHKIALGFAGKGFMNNLTKATLPTDYYLGGGYGGFFIEPIFFSKSVVHFTVPMLIGGGIATAIPQNYMDNSFYRYDDYDTYFVFEPGVDLEVNVVKFFRIGLGASYRFTNGVLITYPLNPPVPTDALNNYNFHINLKFGAF